MVFPGCTDDVLEVDELPPERAPDVSCFRPPAMHPYAPAISAETFRMVSATQSTMYARSTTVVSAAPLPENSYRRIRATSRSIGSAKTDVQQAKTVSRPSSAGMDVCSAGSDSCAANSTGVGDAERVVSTKVSGVWMIPSEVTIRSLASDATNEGTLVPRSTVEASPPA